MLLQFFWRTAKMTPNWTNGLSEAFNRKFTFAFSALALYASGLGLSLLALALAYWPWFTGLGLSLLALVLAYWHWLAYWPWLCMSAVVLRTRTQFGRRAWPWLTGLGLGLLALALVLTPVAMLTSLLQTRDTRTAVVSLASRRHVGESNAVHARQSRW